MKIGDNVENWILGYIVLNENHVCLNFVYDHKLKKCFYLKFAKNYIIHRSEKIYNSVLSIIAFHRYLMEIRNIIKTKLTNVFLQVTLSCQKTKRVSLFAHRIPCLATRSVIFNSQHFFS